MDNFCHQCIKFHLQFTEYGLLGAFKKVMKAIIFSPQHCSLNNVRGKHKVPTDSMNYEKENDRTHDQD